MRVDLNRICKLAYGVFRGEHDTNPRNLTGDSEFQDGEDEYSPSYRHGKPAVSTEETDEHED